MVEGGNAGAEATTDHSAHPQVHGHVAVSVTAGLIRGSERLSGYHRDLHGFIEQLERLLTVLVLARLSLADAP